MTIKYRALNSNETYCCTKNDIKTILGNLDVSVYFGHLIPSRNEKLNNLSECPGKNSADRVLAKMVVCKNRIGISNLPIKSYIIFYILNKEKSLENLRELFMEEAMPQMVLFYNKHKDDDDLSNFGAASLTVTLVNNSFRFYTGKVKRM